MDHPDRIQQEYENLKDAARTYLAAADASHNDIMGLRRAKERLRILANFPTPQTTPPKMNWVQRAKGWLSEPY